MRGIYTPVTDIRRKVFTEVARMSYESNEMADYAKEIRDLPFKIMPGEDSSLRSSIFLERAIVSERIRLAMGLSLRPVTESVSATEDLEHSVIADKYYEPPLINVIKFACNKCPEKIIKVTSMCQGCLAHPCQEVCPKKAISFRNGRSHIDQDLCIKCGRCVTTCPYNAIVDKGQIFQLIQSIKRGDEVIAIVAPAFVNQFPNMTPAKLREAMKRLGFANTAEVAIGADLCTIDEAHDFLEEVPSKHPFMGTSCCPAWSVMAKKNFPKFADCISMAMTPMVLTARLLKQDHPAARICFVGPCAAKKLEASRHSVRSEVDFVLTFEELMGMFEAKQINFDDLPDDPNDNFNNASADGRGFAVSGGVAQAVVNVIKKEDPTREVKVVSAQGLAECKKMMQLAAAGKYNGYLLEGMACPGGCIAGAGTLADPARSAMMLNKYKAQATMKTAADTPYKDTLDKLKY